MALSLVNGFRQYLQLEKGLSDASLEAYIRDLEHFYRYLSESGISTAPAKWNEYTATGWLKWLAESGIGERSRARMFSSLKSFGYYLTDEKVISANPFGELTPPSFARKLPVVLTIGEIESMLNAIDRSTSEGERNYCMLEVMYGCGLRVTELVTLPVSGIHFKEAYIQVLGKGNKERMIPLGRAAGKALQVYMDKVRGTFPEKPEGRGMVFLNRLGRPLSRVMIFNIVKKIAMDAGIKKSISPHTFRHSFATHMVEAGADLRAVQEMLGHAHIVTTEIYTHLDTQYLRDVIIEHHPRS